MNANESNYPRWIRWAIDEYSAYGHPDEISNAGKVVLLIGFFVLMGAVIWWTGGLR